MPTVDLVNIKNEKVGTIKLNDSVFSADVNVALVHQVIKAQRASKRQGTACTKTKGEVRGGGKKPFKQKGTGNARRGSQRSPLMVGGGTMFGPKPRSYDQRTPKEMVRGALRSALSDRLKSSRLIVVDGWELDSHKTKPLFTALKKSFKLGKALIVDQENQNLERSARNIPEVTVIRSEGLNVYDLIRHEWILLTKSAVEAVEARLAK